MKAFAIPTLALAFSVCATSSFAQSKQKNAPKEEKKEETVVIKKKHDGSPQTVIEIKDGEVFINGEKVASTDSKTEYKKIIIDSDDDMGGYSFFDRTFGPRKAMLGVATDADKNNTGAVIDNVTPNSGAEKAGLKPGDKITKLDGKAITGPKDLMAAIEAHDPGDKVTVTYERSGKTANADATLTRPTPQGLTRMYDLRDMPEITIPNPMTRPFSFDINSEVFEPRPKLGIVGEDRADGNGVSVVEVKPGSAAASAGLQKDDVIVKLGDEKTSSVDDLQDILRTAPPNEKMKLQFQRNGKIMNTDVVLPKHSKKKDL